MRSGERNRWDTELGFEKLLCACKRRLCGEFAEAACMGEQSRVHTASGVVHPCVCVGKYRGWATVGGGGVCSQELEDRSYRPAFRPYWV